MKKKLLCMLLYLLTLTLTLTTGRSANAIRTDDGSKMRNVSWAYVSQDGSDQNDGTSPECAFATVNEAINSGATRILIDEGIYYQSIDFKEARGKHIEICNNSKTGRVIFRPSNRILSEFGELEPGYSQVYSSRCSVQIPEANDWIYQEGVSFGIIDKAESHPAQRGRAYRCDDTPIIRTSASTLDEAIEEIESAMDYRWFLDQQNGILYYSSPKPLSAEQPLTYGTQNGLFVNADRSVSLTISGVEAEYVVFNLVNFGGVEAVDCKCSKVYGAGCFRYDASIGAKMIRCEACLISNNGTGDGFNGHAATIGEPFAKKNTCELIDCWAHDIRDDGYSDHECSETVIRGGLFEYCGKGGVTPSYGSHCSCYNVYSRHNYCGFHYVGTVPVDEGGQYGQMICYDCIAENNNRGGEKCGFCVNGKNNMLILCNCKSINNPVHFKAVEETNQITLIDCGASGGEIVKHGLGLFVIKNTKLID